MLGTSRTHCNSLAPFAYFERANFARNAEIKKMVSRDYVSAPSIPSILIQGELESYYMSYSRV